MLPPVCHISGGIFFSENNVKKVDFRRDEVVVLSFIGAQTKKNNVIFMLRGSS